MKGLRVGYIRVSTIEQNIDRQLDGVELDKRFIDKASGKDVKRPEFQSMLSFVREGDLVIVHSMDRLARNLDDLRKIVLNFIQKGIAIQFIKENLTFDKSESPMSMLLLSVMGAFAEFEYALIRERQREGIAIARAKGVYRRTGRKKQLNEERAAELKALVMQEGSNKSFIARKFGISRKTVYNYI